ncbi:hypothetical protein ACOJTA_09350 [Malaciobacter sp. WC5094]
MKEHFLIVKKQNVFFEKLKREVLEYYESYNLKIINDNDEELFLESTTSSLYLKNDISYLGIFTDINKKYIDVELENIQKKDIFMKYEIQKNVDIPSKYVDETYKLLNMFHSQNISYSQFIDYSNELKQKILKENS